MNIVVISESALNQKHGTGAQLLKVFDGRFNSLFHLYFHDWHGYSERDNSFWLRKLHGGRLKRLSFFLARSWWLDTHVQPWKIKLLLRSQHSPFNVAYIVVSDEGSAQRSLSLLKHLKCPYVVHMMDLYHEKLHPLKMAGFRKLLQDAHSVFTTTEAIKEEVLKFDSKKVEVLPVGQEITPLTASFPSPGDPIRILLVGRPYDGGIELLTRSLPILNQNERKIEIFYSGSYFSSLPETLQSNTYNFGHVSREQFEKILSNSHLAYLDGPSKLDNFGCFSALYSICSRPD
jgi:hypothetical protein